MNLTYAPAEEVSFYLSEGCLTQDEIVSLLTDALERIQRLERLLEEERQSNVRASSIAASFYHHVANPPVFAGLSQAGG